MNKWKKKNELMRWPMLLIAPCELVQNLEYFFLKRGDKVLYK